MRDFISDVRSEAGDGFYVVGEYWSQDIESLKEYLDAVDGSTDLFDVPLHFNFHEASERGADYDMSSLLDNTLVGYDSRKAVTFVDNHDTQSSSSLQSTVADWFKPLAYGLILLMREGYPAVFYGDYYSESHAASDEELSRAARGELDADVQDDKVREASQHRHILDILLAARRDYAYGDQDLYFDHPSTVGLVRHGDAEHPGSGLVFLMSNDADGSKVVSIGAEHAGEEWREITGSIDERVTVGDDGCAEFTVRGRNLAVWVRDE